MDLDSLDSLLPQQSVGFRGLGLGFTVRFRVYVLRFRV